MDAINNLYKAIVRKSNVSEIEEKIKDIENFTLSNVLKKLNTLQNDTNT
jgi:hypothetical protein